MAMIYPQKRKPLHATAPLDEIADNVKNSAVVTISKLEKMQNINDSDENDDSDVISSDFDSDEETCDRMCIDDPRIDSREIRARSHVNIETTNILAKNCSEARIRRNIVQAKPTTSINDSQKSIQSKSHTLNFMVYIVLALTVLFILFNLYSKYIMTDNNSSEISNHDNLVLNDVFRTLKRMQSKYKNQKNNLWKEAYVAIHNIIYDRTKPSIIILLGAEPDLLDCLAKSLGNVSSSALNTGSLFLTPEKFESDVGSVIESFQFNVKNKKAVIVRDLLNVNIEALKAFHNFCDKINPLVREVILIITIITDSYDKESNPITFVQDELSKKLNGKMKKDAINPLITRITDGAILAVEPEPSIKDCPLL